MRHNSLEILIHFLAFAAATSALADGGFVWRNRNIDIREPQQKAVILFANGWQDLVLEVKFAGAPQEFGWIVPLPAVPEMTPDDPETFVMLSQMTQEPRFGRSERARMLSATLGGDGVEVLAHERVGIYDATVLAAETGAALANWLAENEFRTTERAAAVFEEYARLGWVFVAMKIAAEEATEATAESLRDGTIQPIRFRFRAVEPVYPLKISSILDGEGQVLLYVIAKKPQVPANCRQVSWKNHLYGTYRKSRLHHIDPAGNYSDLVDGKGYLTKLRATFRPDQMEDVRFQPFDPLPALGSAKERERAEAVSYLGWSRDTSAVQVLLSFLDQRQRPGDDTRSALWALGEIGDPAAVPCLLGWTEHEEFDSRLEAIEALAKLRVPEALQVFIKGIQKVRARRDTSWLIEAEHKICLEHLVIQGDHTCIEPLRKLAADHHGREEWFARESTYSPNIGLSAMAALAACGDETAQKTIREAVIKQGAVRGSDSALRKRTGREGSTNNFPTGFWHGAAIIHDSGPHDWYAYRKVRKLLAARPVVLEMILRAAAHDTRLPDAAKLILLAYLEEPQPKDLALVRQIWDQALVDPLMLKVPITERPRDTITYVEYNANACAVAYTYARLGRVDELLQLWEETPDGDKTLRAEIAFALARTRSPRAAEPVAAYVRGAWNETAAADDFEARLREQPERRPFSSLWANRILDLPYRTRPITALLSHNAGKSDILIGLMTDPALHPYLRLFWIANSPHYREDMVELRQTALTALTELCAGDTTPYMADLAEWLYNWIEEAPARLAALHKMPSRRVYGEKSHPVNRPVESRWK